VARGILLELNKYTRCLDRRKVEVQQKEDLQKEAVLRGGCSHHHIASDKVGES
jgi:hypothetical protein